MVLYRATGVLNLAYGAIGAAGAMLAWQLMHAGHPEARGWLVAVATATALSLLYGRLVAPRLAWREPVVKAVATLGFAMMILAAMNWTWVEAPRKLTLASDGLGVCSSACASPGTRLAALLAAFAVTAAVATFLGTPAPASTCGRSPTTATWPRSSACGRAHRDRRLGDQRGPGRPLRLLFADLVRLNPTVLTFLVIPAIAAAIVGRLEASSPRWPAGF